MKTVKCINDQNLPQGAKVIKGKVYEVEQEYINALDQRVYIIRGIVNDGMTKMGMRWIGYDAMRFVETEESPAIEAREYEFALN
jgi:hypothetical protein